MTTYEQVGWRSLRTGSLCGMNTEIMRTFGPRKSNGRRMNDAEWKAYLEEHFEPVGARP